MNNNELTITLKPVPLEEGQSHCEKCNGLGYVRPGKDNLFKTNQEITHCRHCRGTGRESLCECGNKKLNPYFIRCDECSSKLFEDKEKIRFENATKVKLSEANPDRIKMMFHQDYRSNEGYFEDLQSFIEYCEANEIETPKYVYGTTETYLQLEMYDIVSNACEELFEDAFSNIESDIDELQELVDGWLYKHRGKTTTHWQDEDYIILIGEE